VAVVISNMSGQGSERFQGPESSKWITGEGSMPSRSQLQLAATHRTTSSIYPRADHVTPATEMDRHKHNPRSRLPSKLEAAGRLDVDVFGRCLD
jgi:hypothetical protein